MYRIMRTTVYKYFTSLFVCVFLSISTIKMNFFFYIFLKIINTHIISGVKISKYSFPRIVDPKCESEFIDTSLGMVEMLLTVNSIWFAVNNKLCPQRILITVLVVYALSRC